MNSISVYHCCKNTEYCTAQSLRGGKHHGFSLSDMAHEIFTLWKFWMHPWLTLPHLEVSCNAYAVCTLCSRASQIHSESIISVYAVMSLYRYFQLKATPLWRPRDPVHMIASDARVYTVSCTDLHFCSANRFPVCRYWKRSVLRKWRSGYETRVYIVKCSAILILHKLDTWLSTSLTLSSLQTFTR